jgi:hypothetical protein
MSVNEHGTSHFFSLFTHSGSHTDSHIRVIARKNTALMNAPAFTINQSLSMFDFEKLIVYQKTKLFHASVSSFVSSTKTSPLPSGNSCSGQRSASR